MEAYNFIKLRLLLIFICWLGLLQSAHAQPIKSKNLPEPKFFVIGIQEHQFPKFYDDWHDTIALINYSKQIDNWLNMHQSQIVEFESYKLNPTKCKINAQFFKSLNENQKVKFKEVAFYMAYMIYGQKAKLLKTYFDASSKNKTIRNFYEEAVQVYYIHQDNLDYFYNYIVK